MRHKYKRGWVFGEEVEGACSILEPVMHAWPESPKEAAELLECEGREWRRP